MFCVVNFFNILSEIGLAQYCPEQGNLIDLVQFGLFL